MSIIDDFTCYQNWGPDGYRFEYEVEVEEKPEYVFSLCIPGGEDQSKDRSQRKPSPVMCIEETRSNLDLVGSDGSSDADIPWYYKEKLFAKYCLSDVLQEINTDGLDDLITDTIAAKKRFKYSTRNWNYHVKTK